MYNSIFTIGYGNRSIKDFIILLNSHKINILFDIRSSPYSAFNEPFNKERLQNELTKEGIIYKFLGDKMGGRPDDNSCYDQNGHVDYDILENKTYYREGIQALTKDITDGNTCALMCSELNPAQCHRSKLVGRTLDKKGIKVLHIDEKGRLRSQQDVMLEVLKGKSEINLFGETEMLFSVKKYKK